MMWRDIGLGEWLFDMDVEEDVEKIGKSVVALAQDPLTAKRKVAGAKERVQQRQRETMAIVAEALHR
jgi:hypothetical protein